MTARTVKRHAAASALVVALLAVTGCSTGGTSGRSGPGTPSRTSAPTAPTMDSPASAGSTAASTSPTMPSNTLSATSAVAGTALAALATVTVKGRAPMTGYSRAQFGPAWTDDNNDPLGHDGCDTRNNILARDLSDVRFRSGHCVVASGVLHDPYSGAAISFVRGASTSSAVQIDHVVALGDAWQTGAQNLTTTQRIDYANDPDVLLAVDGPLNQQKSDSDAASWLPPNKAFRCAYVARQVSIKIKYRLWMTPAEKAAIVQVLTRCPGQPLPAAGSPAAPRVQPSTAAPPSRPASAIPPQQPAASSAGSVYYPNCAAARAAGAAPIRRGQPGYRPGLDRDGDGVACES